MKKVNILFTSCGRRVELINLFINQYKDKKISGKIYCGDMQKSAPAFYLGDESVVLPPIVDKKYIPFIKKFCTKNNINLVIPLLDNELELFALHYDEFIKDNITLLISNHDIIQYGKDKKITSDFFLKSKILTPKLYNTTEKVNKYPIILKPQFGSASIGIKKINSFEELVFFTKKKTQYILQEYIEGVEYTIDVWFGLKGKLRSIVPRKRIEVRSGEVSKGITVNDISIINDIKKISNTYSGFRGCITFQCIKDSKNKNYFIEMNPRFGGGVPLSVAAGANFPLALIYEFLGIKVVNKIFHWKKNYVMLRYDQGKYLTINKAGL